MVERLGVFEFVTGDVDFLEHGGTFAAKRDDGAVVLLEVWPREDEALEVGTWLVPAELFTPRNDSYVERGTGKFVSHNLLYRAYQYREYGYGEQLDFDWLEQPAASASIDKALAWEGPHGFLERVAAEAEKYHLDSTPES